MNLITWLAVKTFAKKAWAWCKKYWQLLLGAAIPVVIYLLSRNSDHLDEVLDRVRKDHEKELDVINRSHEQELRDRDEAVKRFQESLAEVERQHREAQVELDSKKKRQIEKILKESADNPEEITRRISELTGIQVRNN